MTAGTKVVNNKALSGYYRSRTWSGGDDPGAHARENVYATYHKERMDFYLEEVRDGLVYLPGSPGYCSYGYAENYKPSMDGDYTNKLLAKVGEEIKGHNFNAGMAFAEVDKTLSSVLGLSNHVLSALGNFASGNWGAATRQLASSLSAQGHAFNARRAERQRREDASRKLTPADVSGQYLAYRYAWEPLVKDIYEAADWLSKRMDPPREIYQKVRQSQRKEAQEWSSNLTVYGSFPATVIISHEIRVKWVEQLSTARSLGLNNPVGIIWERVPLSFVVDWFIPLGTYFDNLSFLSNLELSYARSVYTRVRGRKNLVRCDSPTWPIAWPKWPHSHYCHPQDPVYPRVYHRVKGVPCMFKQRWVDRTIGTSLDVPPPSFKALDKAFSLRHMQNAAAMIFGGVATARRLG